MLYLFPEKGRKHQNRGASAPSAAKTRGRRTTSALSVAGLTAGSKAQHRIVILLREKKPTSIIVHTIPRQVKARKEETAAETLI
jgi:hypothetical protein